MTIYDPEYMARLDAWRRGGQVGPAPTPTVFSPGRAQPIEPPSQGTPYGAPVRLDQNSGDAQANYGQPRVQPTSPGMPYGLPQQPAPMWAYGRTGMPQ
jgi:hypothetical protein